MNDEEIIRSALKKIMSKNEANTCVIRNGYDNGTGRTGWHIAGFGHPVMYFGESVEEVIDAIYDIYDGREAG